MYCASCTITLGLLSHLWVSADERSEEHSPLVFPILDLFFRGFCTAACDIWLGTTAPSGTVYWQAVITVLSNVTRHFPPTSAFTAELHLYGAPVPLIVGSNWFCPFKSLPFSCLLCNQILPWGIRDNFMSVTGEANMQLQEVFFSGK